jgi:hypothetical protein
MLAIKCAFSEPCSIELQNRFDRIEAAAGSEKYFAGARGACAFVVVAIKSNFLILYCPGWSTVSARNGEGEPEAPKKSFIPSQQTGGFCSKGDIEAVVAGLARTVSNAAPESGGVTDLAGGRLRQKGNFVQATNALYRCASGH